MRERRKMSNGLESKLGLGTKLVSILPPLSMPRYDYHPKL